MTSGDSGLLCKRALTHPVYGEQTDPLNRSSQDPKEVMQIQLSGPGPSERLWKWGGGDMGVFRDLF